MVYLAIKQRSVPSSDNELCSTASNLISCIIQCENVFCDADKLVLL